MIVCAIVGLGEDLHKRGQQMGTYQIGKLNVLKKKKLRIESCLIFPNPFRYHSKEVKMCFLHGLSRNI